MKTVILIGTLDTKGVEYQFAKERFKKSGLNTILIDAGIIGQSLVKADISNEEVARAGGEELSTLKNLGDRGFAVSVMTQGVNQIVQDLYKKNQCDGVFALGGSGGSTISSFAMRNLPIGVPKVLVSTLIASNASSFIGESDMALFASVVDIAGINSISAKVIANAVDATIGMIKGEKVEIQNNKKLISASMFGVTTTCVTNARKILEENDLEVITFHMTGSGGKSLENLIRQGFINASLDVTTTELADEIVGGTLSAGPSRLTAARDKKIPQVVSLGALDMVNFGPKETVPEKFKNRNLYVHNENVTLMRTTAEECEKIALDICKKLNESTSKVALMIPLKGVSAIATKGQVFYDEKADEALFSTIRKNLKPNVELIELDHAINDEEFSNALALKLLSYLK
ncbi:MAG: Tm-1-like ATP-binding domain-containing protein [Candidatus Nanopelagicales bacterium]